MQRQDSASFAAVVAYSDPDLDFVDIAHHHDLKTFRMLDHPQMGAPRIEDPL
jgi:hypothetical protein